ncbi:MAG: hypothetical protein ACK559_30105, partial [bacterium]
MNDGETIINLKVDTSPTKLPGTETHQAQILPAPPVSSSLPGPSASNPDNLHQKKTSGDSLGADSQSNGIKPKSKLAKMILGVLDDEALPTADEAEKQREQALAFALQLKAENEQKKKKKKDEKKEAGGS